MTSRMRRTAAAAGLFTLIGLLVSGLEVDAQATPSDVTHLDELEWSDPSFRPRYPQGLQTARVSVDEATGGVTYYARFPAGTRFDMHWHTHDEVAVVVSGRLTIVLSGEAHALEVGSRVLIEGAAPHSWEVPSGGEAAVILVSRAGPADFHFIDRDPPFDSP